jgi:signal transduction histidine kinase
VKQIIEGNGIGLRNCRERLQAQYGEAASLTAERQGDAFTVTIHIGATAPRVAATPPHLGATAP